MIYNQRAMDQIEEIKEKIDIVEFIGARVPLKRAGRNFKARCPFHQEKTPSFSVSPERQIWYCFGACDQGGDIVAFLQKWENLDFSEALKILAGEAGIKLTYQKLGPEKTQKKEQLLTINHLAQEFYHYLLREHKIGKKAREYLEEERGIKLKIIETFKLGYAPSSWDALVKYLTRKGYDPSLIEEAGLAIKSIKGRGFYDRFRGRIIFPIKNHRGEIVGFSGRLLGQEQKEAKYINTPETILYHKRETLYGLAQTGRIIQQENSVIIVEGEFDLLSAVQLGTANVVAVKGSGLTEGQLRLLRRYAGKIIFALDTDQAGKEAIRRGVLMADEEGFDVWVAAIDQGKDPDEVIRKDPAGWCQAIKKPLVYFDYLIDMVIAQFGTETAFSKKAIIEELAQFFARSTNPIIKAHYIKKLAGRMDLSEEVILETLQKAEKKLKLPSHVFSVANSGTGKTLFNSDKKRWYLLEEYLLSLVLQADNPKNYLQIIDEVINFSKMPQSAASKILEKFNIYVQKEKSISTAKFIDVLDKQLQLVADKAYLRNLDNVSGKSILLKELKTAAYDLKILSLKDELEQKTNFLHRLEKEGKEEDLNSLNEKILALSKELQQTISAKKAKVI